MLDFPAMPKSTLPAPARALIRKLALLPHPEGGHYREIHRAAETVGTGKGKRSALTTIYFLLAKGERSLFHRVRSDEVWHHHAGAPLRLWRVAGDYSGKERIALGPMGSGRTPVAVIPAGDWQAAQSAGEFSLVACSVGPGFDFRDFAMLRDLPGEAARMEAAFPGLSPFIG